MENIVEVEIEKNKFLVMEESKAIEFAVQEYFGNNKIVKINNKPFDIFNFGNYKMKLEMQ
ncbi:MAG: hypothetical protein ACI3T9_03880 [Romboutsia timonensis]